MGRKKGRKKRSGTGRTGKSKGVKKSNSSKKKSSKGGQNVGWSQLRKDGTYLRGPRHSRRRAKYDVVRDARVRARHRPADPHKPFAGDSTAVYYVVYRKSGRRATNRVFYSYSSIPSQYKKDRRYLIKMGYV